MVTISRKWKKKNKSKRTDLPSGTPEKIHPSLTILDLSPKLVRNQPMSICATKFLATYYSSNGKIIPVI